MCLKERESKRERLCACISSISTSSDMCIYVRICIYVYTCMYVYIFISIYVYVNVIIHRYMYLRERERECVYVKHLHVVSYVCMYVYINKYVYMCRCI